MEDFVEEVLNEIREKSRDGSIWACRQWKIDRTLDAHSVLESLQSSPECESGLCRFTIRQYDEVDEIKCCCQGGHPPAPLDTWYLQAWMNRDRMDVLTEEQKAAELQIHEALLKNKYKPGEKLITLQEEWLRLNS